MSLMDTITQKAKANQKHVLLPEGGEERTLKAAEILAREGIAKITLLGKEDAIRAKALELGVLLDGVQVVDPEQSPSFAEYANLFYEMRKDSEGRRAEDFFSP